MRGHFERIRRFFQGRTPLVWSAGNAHLDYLDPRTLGHAG
jgi:hypothetical protein